MYTKFVNLLKLIVSVYFVYVGVELIRIMMDQRPADMTKKLLIATGFLVAGAGYFVWTSVHMSERLRKRMEEAWAGWQEEARREEARQDAMHKARVAKRDKGTNRDSSKFRTAPMEPLGESIQGTITIKGGGKTSTGGAAGEPIREQVMPDSWDEATRAMWMDDEKVEDSLQRYWENTGLEE